jgi:glycosyltransferase involved in cell wall biosynthesis
MIKSITYEISVVLTTYQGENPDNLRQSIFSILNQSLKPVELIIVLDGPVPAEQLAIIREAQRSSVFPVLLIDLPKNVGRGQARDAGIQSARSEFVAIMDSDDFSMPERLACQLALLQMNSQIDVVASLSLEIDDKNWSAGYGIVKSCPEAHSDISNALRLSNCIANPTIIFKKVMWYKVGGYGKFSDINEDYIFFLRLISAGAKLYCIQKPLVRVRTGEGQRRRRKGIKLFMTDVKFRFLAFKEGHINFFWTIWPLILIFLRRFMPSILDPLLYLVWRKLGRLIYRI